MKLRNLFYLFAMPLAFVACSEETGTPNTPDTPGNDPTPVLTITSEMAMQFSSEGGEGVITYTLENEKEGVELNATCSADWVTDITEGETITFNVAKNEGEKRNAIITVAYGELVQNVVIQQLSITEVAFKANYFTGEYYGSIFSPGVGNYFMHLSENGFNEDGKDLPNSKYYALDLYGPVYEGEGSDNVPLPVGTYTLKVDADKEEWTIGYDPEYSAYRESDEYGSSLDPYPYDSATLVVTEKGATLTATIEGITHHVTFEGEPEVVDMRY